jgi:hypothetical protein
MLPVLGAGFISLSLGVQPTVYAAHSAEGMMSCAAGVVCFRGFHLVCVLYSLVGCTAAVGLISVVRKQRAGLAAGGSNEPLLVGTSTIYRI